MFGWLAEHPGSHAGLIVAVSVIAGIVTAWALTGIAVLIPQVPAGARPHISVVTAATSIALLTLAGLVAGVGPARRAAAVDPAEALRADLSGIAALETEGRRL